MSLVCRAQTVLREEGLVPFLAKGTRYATTATRDILDRAVATPIKKARFERRHGTPVDVMERDWDYLILLDACRYDFFADQNTIDGELDSVFSAGSHSKEFCRKHFASREFYDTVYVTANGYGARIGAETFHDLVFTDESDAVADVDILHSTMQGLAPQTVSEAAVRAHERHPHRRLVVHFMQPHMPYLGDRAAELRRRVEQDGLVVRSRDPEKIAQYDVSNSDVVSGLDGAYRNGVITADELREVYAENLDIVLEHVTDLIDQLDGKVVVTADHGEYLGERGLAGHYEHEYTEALRKVPWLVVESDHRPKITTEPPTHTQVAEADAVEERLRTLGYTE